MSNEDFQQMYAIQESFYKMSSNLKNGPYVQLPTDIQKKSILVQSFNSI